MLNKHKLFTILAASVTAFSFLTVATPTKVNAAPEGGSGGG